MEIKNLNRNSFKVFILIEITRAQAIEDTSFRIVFENPTGHHKHKLIFQAQNLISQDLRNILFDPSISHCAKYFW